MAVEPKGSLGVNYWRLWSATVISNFGDGLSAVAYPWLASAITRDPVAIAGTGIARFLPWLLFTLPAGAITDRVDRRRLVAWMDVIRTFLTVFVAIFVLAGQHGLASPDEIAAGTADPPANAVGFLAMLYITGFLFGLAEVFRDNAAQTILPSIVQPSQLEKANGRLWGAESIMNSFVGPPVGGVLLAVAFSLPFFVDAGSFALAAGLVFLLGGQFKPKTFDRTDTSIRSEIREGVSWLWRHSLLRPMALILGFLNGLNNVAMATLVLFIQEILDLGAAQYGLMLSSFAVGSVVGSFTASKVSEKLGSGTSLYFTLGASAVVLIVTGATSRPVVVWILFAVSSYVGTLWSVITVSLRQTIIPDHLLGRVNSFYRLMGWGTIPIGMFLGGLIVDITEALTNRDLGLRMPFYLAGAVYVVLFFYSLPRLTTAKIEAAREEAVRRKEQES
jgi:MFS family permease